MINKFAYLSVIKSITHNRCLSDLIRSLNLEDEITNQNPRFDLHRFFKYFFKDAFTYFVTII